MRPYKTRFSNNIEQPDSCDLIRCLPTVCFKSVDDAYVRTLILRPQDNPCPLFAPHGVTWGWGGVYLGNPFFNIPLIFLNASSSLHSFNPETHILPLQKCAAQKYEGDKITARIIRHISLHENKLFYIWKEFIFLSFIFFNCILIYALSCFQVNSW